MSLINSQNFASQVNATIIGAISPDTINRVLTRNAANRMNIMSSERMNAVMNPEEEVIRRRGRKTKRKASDTPVRHSPRIVIKIMKMSNATEDVVDTIGGNNTSGVELESESSNAETTPKQAQTDKKESSSSSSN